MSKSVVTSKGQVTIPVEIRKKAHIQVGAELNFSLTAEGNILVRPVSHSLTELKGLIKPKNKKPVSLEDMKKAIRDATKRKIK